MRKRMGNGADLRSGCGTDMGIKWGNGYGDKMRHFNEFFRLILRFCVFYLCFFVMDATSC